MKLFLLMIISAAWLWSGVGHARTVEIDVHGMTCAFCVDSLQRAFGKNKSVRKVDISLELKKVRLETDGDLPSDETIRQTILDAGFTPVSITEVPDVLE